MNLQEDLKMKGELSIRVFDREGNLKEAVNHPNLVVTVGKNYIASRMAANSTTVMSHMSIGTGTGTLTKAMLCRTTFPVVNKASGDSIAITWTVTVS